MQTMQHGTFHFDDDDAQGVEEVLCDPATISICDTDKIQKKIKSMIRINI